MAGSRTFKIGTIFSRTTGLIKAGAKRWEDRPLWYDVYEAFPPKTEPDFNRPEPAQEIRPIFYSEDILRAKFYREFGNVGLINLSEVYTRPTICQLFIEEYLKLKKNTGLSEDKLWEEVIMILENRGIRLVQMEHEAKETDATLKAPTLTDLFSQANEVSQRDAMPLEIGTSEAIHENENLQFGSKPLEINLADIFSEEDKERE